MYRQVYVIKICLFYKICKKRKNTRRKVVRRLINIWSDFLIYVQYNFVNLAKSCQGFILLPYDIIHLNHQYNNLVSGSNVTFSLCFCVFSLSFFPASNIETKSFLSHKWKFKKKKKMKYKWTTQNCKQILDHEYIIIFVINQELYNLLW